MSSNDPTNDLPPLRYPTLDAFVEGFISVVYERATDGSQTLTWCPQWWMHDEAVLRLRALWTAWEHMRLHDGPTAMAAWLVEYADPIMATVLSVEAGPFRGCKTTERGHKPDRPHPEGRLPCHPAPAGLFDEPQGQDQWDEEEAIPPQYPTLDAFVEGFISVVYERATDGSQTLTWCPQWWMHDEAVLRLRALWTAWEHMRLHDGPTAMAAWLVEYADPIMATVLSVEAGPFRGCKTTERGHKPDRPHPEGRLPCHPAPAGLFDERR